ncbi:MAG: ATP-binding cassette domain-containing protein, partial [Lachnospiraceae bacterium]|nr:ATP-binding cassette domain-containing protein [Lachnospiraceae bacterium]
LKEPDLERISQALAWADLLFDTKPDQMVLGKEFGGSELSGGQWQRIALARSYYRKRRVLLFDEPTAAIDPLEEMELYGKLNELAGDKTVILVTHRLGAVRNADKIIVMNNGRIAEMGTFDELMGLQGYFHNIWTEQTKWYQEA